MSDFDAVKFVERLRVAHDKVKHRVSDETMTKAERIELLKSYGAPERYVRVLRDALRKTKAITALRTFQASDDELLVLSGGPGVGKSAAAVVWLYDLLEKEEIRGRRKRWFYAGELTRSNNFEQEHRVALHKADCLVIDDLGSEAMKDNDVFSAVFDEIIEARYSKNLRTLITTNLNAVNFKARYGERVADRIRESGRFVGINDKTQRQKEL